jgi:hypothetical protein
VCVKLPMADGAAPPSQDLAEPTPEPMVTNAANGRP